MQPRRYILIFTAPILVTSILLLGLGGAAAWNLHRLNLEVSDLMADNLACAVASQQLVSDIRDARIRMHQFIDTGDDAMLQSVLPIEQTAAQQLQDAKKSATTDEIVRLIDQTGRNEDRFFAEFKAMMRDTPPELRQQRVRELSNTITTDLLAPAEELLKHTQDATFQHMARNRSLADTIGLGLLALGACGAVGGLMAGFGIASGIARRIEQSEREATRSGQLASLGQLAAGLAHELRNPLTAIRVLVEAGREPSVGSPTGFDGRDLQVLDEEIERLEKLVESFLDFARPPKLEKRTLDVRSLVEQTLHLVGGPARQRGVRIQWKPPSEAIPVEADAVQTRQVLLNLLLNALDAAGESGKVTIEIEQVGSLPQLGLLEGSDPDRLPHVAIHVSDTGPGIPDDQKSQIFEPFVSSKDTGMGLGLAVSRRIVEAHGGTIDVTNNPGGGARFTICLPCSASRMVSVIDAQARSV